MNNGNIDPHTPPAQNNDTDNTNTNADTNNGNDDTPPNANTTSHRPNQSQSRTTQKDPNSKLRSIIQNALHNPNNGTTPSPSSAVFFASILYTKTQAPKDAYLFAQCLFAAGDGEKRRAVFVLEKAGLLTFENLILNASGNSGNR